MFCCSFLRLANVRVNGYRDAVGRHSRSGECRWRVASGERPTSSSSTRHLPLALATRKLAQKNVTIQVNVVGWVRAEYNLFGRKWCDVWQCKPLGCAKNGAPAHQNALSACDRSRPTELPIFNWMRAMYWWMPDSGGRRYLSSRSTRFR